MTPSIDASGSAYQQRRDDHFENEDGSKRVLRAAGSKLNVCLPPPPSVYHEPRQPPYARQ